MRGESPYNGEAHVSAHGDKRVRVEIEANNVRAEVYIDKPNAAEIRDTLDQILKHWPRRVSEGGTDG